MRLRVAFLLCSIFSFLCVTSVLAQPLSFTWQISSIQVLDEEQEPFALPFLGGLNIPRPQLVDIDADGDLDLFVQEKSDQIKFFEYNQNQAGFPYQWRTDHFQSLAVGEWFRFADLDGDGDQDLLAERRFSLIQFYRNVGTANTPVFRLAADTLFVDDGSPVFADRQNIPNVTDIDCDGQLDLFVGRLDGKIRRYEVTAIDGNGIPIFVLADEQFQDIEIIGEVSGKRVINAEEGESDLENSRRHGANTITFFDIDDDGDDDMFWGDFFEAGLLYFENKGSCEAPDFSGEPESFPINSPLATSGYNAPTFGDINQDGRVDLLAGVLGGAFSASANAADNLIYYQGQNGPEMELISNRFLSNLDFGSDSFPALHDLDMDGDLDLVVGNSLDPGNLNTAAALVFENVGTASVPVFQSMGQLTLESGFNFAPTFADLDADGDDDMLVGSWLGEMAYYEKTGLGLTDFTMINAAFLDLPSGSNSVPAFIDIDNDDDLDLIVGEANGTLNFFENTGTSTAPLFEPAVENWMDIDVGRRSVPIFRDMDQDGDADLIVGTDQDGILFYRNAGSPTQAVFEQESTPFDLPITRRMTPAFNDLDADGDFDLMIGGLEGGLLFYENQAIASGMDAPGVTPFLQFEVFPNPASSKATLQLKTDGAEEAVAVMLYDALGRHLRSIYQGNSGVRQVEMDMSDLPAGVYFLIVEGEKSGRQIKTLIIGH